MQKKRGSSYYFKLFFIISIQLALAVFLVIGYSVNAWTQSMLHPRRIPSTGDSLPREQISYQDIKLTTKDGIQLAAWYTPPENGAVILVAHGYGDNRPENIYTMFASNGYGVLAWDFRAHGESAGDISTLGYFEQLDAEAALDYALAQPGVEHIGRVEIEAVVADSAFPALEDVLRGSMPYEFLFPLVRIFGEYQSGADIGAVSPVHEIEKISPRAVFIIDGWDGNIKETSSPHRLYNAAAEPKIIWTEEEIPHMGMQAEFPNQYQNKVIGFFNEWLLGK
jgi:uncharacterized protein